MKNILEKIIEEKSYDDLGNWCLPSLSKFSDAKTLFEYQNQAIRNIIKVLHEYFGEENGKQHLFDLYKSHGLDNRSYAVEKYTSRSDKQNSKINSRFSLFQNHFKIVGNEGDEYISGSNFMNRACFWMATGSGKSLVLIKTIELLDYLQSQGIIPKKEIMLLLPREDLIKQFTKEIAEFNKGRERHIELVNLKRYEDDKQGFAFDNSIKVYYYRSDLIRDERKENILDYRSYENNGNWYVFLDEAHRGGKEDSLMQDYVSILSKNGFSFNFSATFTDNIDYLTTCYNFNLEKFILAGYGKNLYLSQSYFSFTKDKDDFSEREKQKQVLKSLITFALVKKQKKENSYHHPLLITLVNSINTDDADLLIIFQKARRNRRWTY
jgi:type III restriction enzyme